MKRIIYLTVILLVFQSCIDNTEKKLRNNPWINASGTEIIELKGDSILFTYLFKDTKKYKFKLKNNKIFLNDSISFGTIDSITDNLLKLGIKSGISSNNLFYPIKKIDCNIDTTDFRKMLLSNPWSYKINDAVCRLDFYKENWFVPKWSLLWSNERIKNIEDLEVKDWVVREYNGTLFLLMIDHGINLSLFQITEINDSTISTSASFDAYAMFDSLPVNLVFNKVPSADSQKINRINNLLTDSRWELFDSEVLAKNYEVYDGKYRDIEPRRSRIQYNDTIKKIYDKYYSDKTLNYSFLKQKGYITISDDTLRRGGWELSTDGKYVFANPPSFLSCLKIIELNDSIFICKQEKIIELINQTINEKRYIKETLKRKTLPNK